MFHFSKRRGYSPGVRDQVWEIVVHYTDCVMETRSQQGKASRDRREKLLSAKSRSREKHDDHATVRVDERYRMMATACMVVQEFALRYTLMH